MDNTTRSASGSGNNNNNAEDIPDDLRCKRSDGKQWRCTALSMPDKTVCEKHYIQAKKRAANSALRANLKKAKRKALGESDIYLESKNAPDFDRPLIAASSTMKVEDFPVSGSGSASGSGKKYKEKTVLNNQVQYSPETPVRRLPLQKCVKPVNDDLQRDVEFEESLRSYKTPPLSAVDSSRSRSRRSFDASPTTEYSDGSTNSSEDAGGQTCHQCRKTDRSRVIWCGKCDRRGFCDNCISTRYSDISLEEIEKVCPACRGICNCKVCLRTDNMVKVRIREIPVLDKLQYLYCILSSVLPVVKQIHQEQCSEVELEKKLCGTDIDLVRAKVNADEQMCCNICRIPIIDYHRHCANCSYDLCLHCCQDLREASKHDALEDQMDHRSQDKETAWKQLKESRKRLDLSEKCPGWNANHDGSIPCPLKEYGGCNRSSLSLSRIFKMNWVAKLVKNAEEMVSGCKVCDGGDLPTSGFNGSALFQCAHRVECDDNFLYCPSSEDLKINGIKFFRKHWVKGEPVIVKKVFDSLPFSSWDPMVIWKGIRETSDEKMKVENRLVKAVDCLNWSEVDIELGEFIKGYSEGRFREDGSLQMLKLKDWPSPVASEEFLLYQRPEFINKLPLLEYIHSRLGLLNVAAKLPHYSLQNDAGPKIYISYGTNEELSRGDSVTRLHIKMRDMVYLLMHTHEVKPQNFKVNESLVHDTSLDERTVDLSLSGLENINDTDVPSEKVQTLEDEQMAEIPTEVREVETVADKQMVEILTEVREVERIEDEQLVKIPTEIGEVEKTDDQGVDSDTKNEDIERIEDKKLRDGSRQISVEACPGVHWDIFRRQDVPKLVLYLQKYFKEFEKPGIATRSLYDGTYFLNAHHMNELKEEFGVEPWSFEQNLGQAIFVPTGCPFQVRNLQSTVQLGLDFLSPESVNEAARLAEEIRCLPNDHEAKVQFLEVGKISLYAASSTIKEVQKLVLDPKLGAEIGFEDPNLTAAVSDNLEKISKQREIRCA